MALNEYEQELLSSALRRDDISQLPTELCDTFERFKKISDRICGGHTELNPQVLAIVVMLSGVETDVMQETEPPKRKKHGTAVRSPRDVAEEIEV